jgi:hypothetical protein
MPHFECGAFDHSATSPDMLVGAISATRFIAAVLQDDKRAAQGIFDEFVTAALTVFGASINPRN